MAGIHRHAGRLPVDPTSFVGRRPELDESTRLLRTARLLTLTGVGGVRKTRLALQVDARMNPAGGARSGPVPARRAGALGRRPDLARRPDGPGRAVRPGSSAGDDSSDVDREPCSLLGTSGRSRPEATGPGGQLIILRRSAFQHELKCTGAV